jgi:HAMP domain-containing protein
MLLAMLLQAPGTTPPDPSGAPLPTLPNFTDIPWGAYMIPLGVLLAGLVLWIAGRKVVKPITSAVFGLIGATVGYLVVGPMPAAANLAPLWAWTFGFLALGLILGAVLYRFAMSMAMGLTLAAAGLLTAAVVTGPPANPTPPITDTSADAIERVSAEAKALRERLLQRLNDASLALAQGTPTTTPPADGQAAKPMDATEKFLIDAQHRASAFASAVWQEAVGAWNARSPTQRLAMLVAAGVGFILGTWLGTLLPDRTAGAVTAFAGAALWLSAGAWLVTAAGLPGAAKVEGFSAAQWLVIWAAIALVGVGIQWSGLARPRKKRVQPAE